ncbi:MAG: SDR family NAD(P)-dependent oxidoreductase [Planctomycetota bacterium]|jgi:NAD(P)-dependent dehydrogenase (short-subunit alcohol dehydrogenase family)
MNPDRFKEKVAIVTGASSGIGKAIALQIAREGAAIAAVADRNVEGGETTVREIIEGGGRAAFVKADVSKPSDCERVVVETVAAFGAVDVLVNNAGITRAKHLEEMDEEFWDMVLDTNLKSAVFMSRFAVPEMLKRGGGSVVNISSVHGEQTAARHTAYAASKAGMCGATRALAIEFGGRDVRFNAVLPGAIDISLYPRSNKVVDRAKWQPRAEEIQITGRSGSPHEIAEAVCFLASNEASYITGAALVVDGGLLTNLKDRP